MAEEKIRQGWVWKKINEDSGFWIKNIGEAHKHKVPFFCPHCSKPCGDVDEKHLITYGICWECYTMNVEDRVTPLLDLSKYKK
jgi:hypothetical protein